MIRVRLKENEIRTQEDMDLYIDVPPGKLIELGFMITEPNPIDLNENGEMEVSRAIMIDIYEYCK